MNRPKRIPEQALVPRGDKARKGLRQVVQEFPKNMVVVGSGDASATWILVALLGSKLSARSAMFKRLFAN